VNTVDFTEVKQNWQRVPENLPIKPLGVGKVTNFRVTAINPQGVWGKP
jgi:hypothetical protein